jgi:hypothetical protein
MILWRRRPSAPIAMSTVTFNSNCSAEPQPSLQLAYAIDRPMSAAAGMVVTEMKTPMSALAKRDAHDGVIFRSYDHGTHDEYLRIGQDANSTNQPGNSQEDEEAGRVDGI